MANDQSPFILTLDIGTSSVRGTLWDGRGQALLGSVVQIKHQPHATADGGVEFEPQALRARCEQVIDALCAQAVSLGISIAAVAIDTIVSNMLGVDDAGEPLTAILTYADTRSASALALLRERLDADAVYQRAGFPLHTAFWPMQITWLRMTQPEVHRRVRHWLTYGDYFLWHWCGAHALSYPDAAWTGLLDRFTRQWQAPLLEALQIEPEQLPPLVGAKYLHEGLRAEYASRWPLLKTAKWLPAIPDGGAANFGTGCFDETRMAVTVGTTCGLRVVMNSTPAHLPQGLWCYPWDETRSLLGGSLNEGGGTIAWLSGLLSANMPDESAIAEIAPDSHGLTFLPLLTGERSLGWRGDARGALTGLHLSTTAAQLARAGLEAIAYRIGAVAERMLQAATPVQQIIGNSGGLLNSPTLPQIVTDVVNRPLTLTLEPEASSRGAALWALEVLGAQRASEAQFGWGQTFAPHAGRHAIYAQAMRRQQTLYRQVIEGHGV